MELVCAAIVPASLLCVASPQGSDLLLGAQAVIVFSGGFRFFRAMLNSEGTAGTAKAGGLLGLSRDPLRKARFSKLLFASPEGKSS